MINYSAHFSKELTAEIRKDFATRVLKNLELLSESCRVSDPENYNSLLGLASINEVSRIIFCKPKRFKDLVDEIFMSLPIIADRYNSKYIFSKGHFNFDFLKLNGATKEAKEIHSDVRRALSAELQRLNRDFDSYISRDLDIKLNANTSINNTKKILSKVHSFISGKGKLTKDDKALFPRWVNDFYGSFDYEFFSQNYGYKLVAASMIKVCPYCNAEEIPTILGVNKNHRPALDHFLPRSKYPFLGVSIYNLIPAGDICNTSFKSDVDFLDGYLNPLITGIEHKNLFHFNYNMVLDGVEVNVRNIPIFEENKKIFEIERRYMDDKYKESYLNIRRQYKILKDLNNNEDISKDKILMNGFFKTDQVCKKTINLKFEREVLKHVISNLKAEIAL